MAEDEESRPTNPRDSDSGEKGKSVASGVTPDFAGHVTPDLTVTKLESLNSNIFAITQTEGAKHVDSNNIVRP